MDLALAGKVVLVTGGSKGIGLAVARGFAEEGCSLRLVARTAGPLEEAAAALRAAHGVAVSCHALDLADPAARDYLPALVDGVDILVNNAGSIPAGTLEEVDEAAWRTGWDLKVFGYIALSRACFRAMKARRQGVIVNVIGTAAERLDSRYIAGSTGNAALVAFTRALGSTSDACGIRVVGVSPGPVESERLEYLVKRRASKQLGDEARWTELLQHMPFGRPARPAEIASAVVFLASGKSSYTSGCVLTIDGGLAARGAPP